MGFRDEGFWVRVESLGFCSHGGEKSGREP